MSERNIKKTDEQIAKEAANLFQTLLITTLSIFAGVWLLAPPGVRLPLLALIVITLLLVLVLWFHAGD